MSASCGVSLFDFLPPPPFGSSRLSSPPLPLPPLPFPGRLPFGMLSFTTVRVTARETVR
ncbi:hypothetical protein HMPREF0620_0264 [Parascardovia denticolens DSM 10105 = JCM 12538]|uniref:Uncharacterized protein n=1 Tax=Parascardovia denticolens DSM 10105 = JCM 12538 TaxID=864564 RepID=E6K017_PARDN|nr:hypothetical protein HMPREF0620_0264 [Parascardovia denticolens DSM 10105 = JCM 12538]BAR05840.1 hypothetical protein PSDT_1321 [Parascardovia denticolens DSM 10105 = JCM 12538]